MKTFDSAQHTMTLSDDGSYTAYSKEYDEHYHSTKDGALNESLLKHVQPAFTLQKAKDELHILDICFGLGFNTLATLYYHQQNNLQTKLYIYSPELDAKLVASLKEFTYPKEFEDFKQIIEILVDEKKYSDANFHIELFVGDAREYIKKLEKESFDIVYQDAFSPSVNPILWTKEYFADIAKIIKKDGILTTYSTAFKTRLALHENGFQVYLNSGENFRNATLASHFRHEGLELVDMEHKISCNQDVQSLRDDDI